MTGQYFGSLYQSMGVTPAAFCARTIMPLVDTYVYRSYKFTGDVGMSTAAGFLQNLVGFICIMGANAIVRRLDEDSSLF